MLRLLAITAGVAMAANVELGQPGLRAPRRRAQGSSASGSRSEKKAKKKAAFNLKRKNDDEDTLADYYDDNAETLRTAFTTEFGRDCTNIKGGVVDWKKKCKTLARENTFHYCFYDYVDKKCMAGSGPGSSTNTGGVAGQGR